MRTTFEEWHHLAEANPASETDRVTMDRVTGGRIRDAVDIELAEACRILTLAGPCAPVLTASWRQAPDWVPCSNQPSFTEWAPFEAFAVDETAPLNLSDCERIATLNEKYAELPDEMTNILELSIDRLNLAVRRKRLVDAFIDLGISFENVFLRDFQKNDPRKITSTLKNRVAGFLGCSRTLVDQIYGGRSAGAHRGRLDSSHTEALRQKRQKLMADALEKIISNGELPPLLAVS